MEMLFSLWLPIIVCAVVLFFASFLAWAVLPHHKPDFKKWPDEGRLLEFIRESGAAPGEYIFPWCGDNASMKDPAVQEKLAAGPWGVINVQPGQCSMGRNMALTLLYFLVVSFFIGYVGAAALAPGAGFRQVLQITGTTAILAYTASEILHGIWFTRPLRAKLMNFIDGVVYGVITGVIFGILWP